jgi:hypothetical protein
MASARSGSEKSRKGQIPDSAISGKLMHDRESVAWNMQRHLVQQNDGLISVNQGNETRGGHEDCRNKSESKDDYGACRALQEIPGIQDREQRNS